MLSESLDRSAERRREEGAREKGKRTTADGYEKELDTYGWRSRGASAGSLR